MAVDTVSNINGMGGRRLPKKCNLFFLRSIFFPDFPRSKLFCNEKKNGKKKAIFKQNIKSKFFVQNPPMLLSISNGCSLT